MARYKCYNRDCMDGKIYCSTCCGYGHVSSGLIDRILGTEKQITCSGCKGRKYYTCSDCSGKGTIEARND